MDPSLPVSGPHVKAAPTITVAQFMKNLAESGLFQLEEMTALTANVDHYADGKQLALDLVKQEKLTLYQATMIYQGKRGLLLGRYVILEKLGAGGMGMVYKARQKGMGRIVAIKVLPPAVCKNPVMVQRFQREVQAAAQLSHPNIVRAYDADNSGNVHFLVMEYVEGSDLSRLVKAKGPLSVTQAVTSVVQAARGLAAAHAAGVVHRDIKPGNLLLDSKGTVKILDMGLARFDGGINSAEAAAADEITKSGSILGTTDYMAPEQAINTKKADQRADIYSLGCTLHYLLTAKPMFGGETPMEKLLAHREADIPSLCAARPETPEALAAVFERMVAKKPADRYQTMEEAARDLEDSLADEGRRLTSLKKIAQVVPGPAPDSEALDDTMAEIASATATTLRRQRAPGKVGKVWWLAGSAVAVAALLLLIAVGASRKPAGAGNTTTPVARATVLDAPAGFVALCNGKDLGGWQVPPGNVSQWEVEGGRIRANGQHSWLMTRDVFADFELRLEYQVASGGDGGVALRALAPLPTPNIWEHGLEVQIRDDAGYTGGPKGPIWDNAAVVKAIPVSRSAARPAGWNQLAIVLVGRQLRVELNGTEVHNVSLDAYRKVDKDCPGLFRRRGHIGLQSCKGPIEFRNLYVKRLDAGISAPVTPVDDSWLRAVTSLPAAKQVEAVGRKLQELNPDFSGRVDSRTDKGQVRELSFYTDAVTDLSPLRALPGLEGLTCCGSSTGKGKLADLRSLSGMPLKRLLCFYNPALRDLTPLKGMPLEVINFGGQGVQVADLGPLAAMPLKGLMFSQSQVTDLAPVRGMALTVLHCSDTRVSDLSLLRGMPLTIVYCDGSFVQDLTPIKDAPVKELRCNFKPERDAALLRSMPTLEKINDLPAAEFWKKLPSVP